MGSAWQGLFPSVPLRESDLERSLGPPYLTSLSAQLRSERKTAEESLHVRYVTVAEYMSLWPCCHSLFQPTQKIVSVLLPGFPSQRVKASRTFAASWLETVSINYSFGKHANIILSLRLFSCLEVVSLKSNLPRVRSLLF